MGWGCGKYENFCSGPLETILGVPLYRINLPKGVRLTPLYHTWMGRLAVGEWGGWLSMDVPVMHVVFRWAADSGWGGW